MVMNVKAEALDKVFAILIHTHFTGPTHHGEVGTMQS